MGHSSHSWDHFVSLLHGHRIDVVIDTRSSPYSRFAPQFDRESLKESLQAASIKYLWLGSVIGGRPRQDSCYDAEGRVLYSRVAQLPEFREGIERIERGARDFRLALLCSEEDPAHCHRRLLIARVLIERGAAIEHIRGDHSIDTDDEIARKSGKPLANTQPGLFAELDETKWRSSAPIGKRAAGSIFE